LGQKVNPISFRIGVTRSSSARWYANKRRFGEYLVEDQKLRAAVLKSMPNSGIAKIEIERGSEDAAKLFLYTSKPGVVIGRRGAEIERLTQDLAQVTGRKIDIEIKEIQTPELEAQLVAEAVAEQLSRRGSFRRAMKKALNDTMRMGALGMKIRCAGRLGGSEMARVEVFSEGSLPLHTLDADIDYGAAEALTTYGRTGVKVWIYRGKISKETPPAESPEAPGEIGE